LVSAFIICFDLLFTHYFLGNNPHAVEGNPINAYFADIFGLNYFLVLIPVVLVLLYGAAKLAGWIIKTYYKKSQIRGDNHAVIFVILMTLPNFLFNEVSILLFGTKPMLDFRWTLIVSISIVAIYMITTEIIDAEATKDQNKI